MGASDGRGGRRALAGAGTMSRSPVDLVTASERLVEQEADLLDEARFREWLELFSADATYWVPLSENQASPSELNIILDDRRRMEQRIQRLEGGHAYAQSPRSRTVRLVANIHATPEGADLAVVRSKFTLLEVRYGQQTVYGGRYTHRIMRRDGRLYIQSKRVDLVNSEARLGNLSFLL